MDFVESEEIELANLDRLVTGDLATHWEVTVEFLKVVTEYWPQYLADNRLVSPVARRTMLMTLEAERLARGSPYPVIAAGSTGTVPATARLLKTIASLPNGAVVLPGLDLTLDDDSWSTLAEHPEHPQASMAKLLRKLGASRAEVAYVPGAAPDAAARARLHLVSEALRPAERTDHWQTFLAGDELAPDGRAGLANGLAGIRAVTAPTAHDEAEAIALILRSVAETPGKTAALVTPDRVLARRVAARLKRYDLAVDDSAGLPLARSVPGAFLDLVLGAFEKDFAPPELMALLKHPLALLGRSPYETRAAARALERGAFRDVYVGEGFDGARAALAAARAEGKRGPLALTEEEHEAALRLIDDLEAAFAPLTALRQERGAGDPAGTGPCRHGGGSRARCRRLVLWPLAGRCGRGSVGAARRADRRRPKSHARRGRLSAVLSQPARRPGGAAARGAPPASVHLGSARSAPAAARRGDPRQPQRRSVASAAGRRPVAQPADARDAWAAPARRLHRPLGP